jgi:O-antigen ligase
VPFGISMGAAGLFIISDYSKTLIFGLLIILAIRSARDLYTFAWAYVAGTAVLCWMAIFLFNLSSMGSKAARLGRLYGWDANDVGVIMVIGLAMTLLTLQTSGRLGRIVSGGLLVAIGITVGRTGSRGAFLGVVAVGVALLFLLNSVSVLKRLALVGAAALALTLWAPPGYWDQMGTLVKPKEDYNWSATDGRKEVAMRGAKYMLAYPFFGLGINNFSKAECFESDKARNHIAGTGIRCTAPHNSYVQAGAELGIPGLVLWLMLLFGGVVGMLRLRRKLPAAWARGSPEERFLYLAPMYLAVAMLGFAVSATFVSFAWLDPVYYLGAMMAGLWVVARRRLAADSGSVGPQPRMPGWRHQQSK